MNLDDDDVLEDLSYSFYTDRQSHSFIDSHTVNNYKTVTKSKSENVNQTIIKSPSLEELQQCCSAPDPLNHLSSRTREKWVEDSAVNKCKGCSCTFRIYRRRHHCYSCGLVYCDTCTSHRSKIPRVVKKVPTRSGTEEPINYDVPVRLCGTCFNNYETIHKLEKLLTVFSLMDLTLFDFKNLSLVCKAWRPMALFYLSKFREIQYKLPKYPYNNWEKQALWSNRYILKNHSIWQVHILRSLRVSATLATSLKITDNLRNRKMERERIEDNRKFNEIVRLYYDNKHQEQIHKGQIHGEKTHEGQVHKGKNVAECWERMCSRYCRQELDAERALLLLDVLDPVCPDGIKNYVSIEEVYESLIVIAGEIISAFDSCTDYILECYLPYILFKLISNNNIIIKEWIITRCTSSIRIANACYWFLKNNSKTLFAELCEQLPQTIFSKILKSEAFVEMAKENTFVNSDRIISPVNPELGEQTVNEKGISVKKSATNPTFIPCDKSSVLFKKDDIRRDQIIMCVIRLMEKILQDSGLDVSIVTYNVQPTSNEEGFIAIVENCETLYSISETLKTTIMNYLMRHNPDESVSNLRNRFKNSCAIYSVIAFLLSISDRNTENLMVTSRADFFEVDYSFVLSAQAKILKTSCIRITPQMLDALGGAHSKEFGEFQELCGVVYDILRRHVNTFVCLLSLIPTFKSTSRTSPNISEEDMFAEIVKRFCPGETYNDAIKNLKTRVEESSDYSTFSKYYVIDLFHKVKKEETISNVLYSSYSGTKTVLSSMYSYLYSFGT